jgi:uncharacterized protein YecA (UPF0149 family)
MATPAQVQSTAPKPQTFAAYDRLVTSNTTRTDELFAALHEGFPKQCLNFEQIVHQFAIAQQRKEFSQQLEASFFNAIIATELADPETAAEVEKFGEAIVLGRAMKRDAEGPNVFAKIMRYMSAANKELTRASVDYFAMRQIIRENNEKEKANPIPPAPPRYPSISQLKAKVETPRNSTCPCGSGQKYKRCCGVHSPAVLCTA